MPATTLPKPKGNTKLDHAKTFAGLKTDADFAKDAAGIKTTGETWQRRVHRHALAVIYRATESGDIRPMAARANALIAAMPEGARKNGLRAWFEKNAKLTYCEDGEAKGTFIQGAMKLRDLDFNASVAAPAWWDMKPEAPYQPFDLDAQVAKLLKLAQARLKRKLAGAKGTEGDHIDPARLAALEQFVATLGVQPVTAPAEVPANASADPLAMAG